MNVRVIESWDNGFSSQVDNLGGTSCQGTNLGRSAGRLSGVRVAYGAMGPTAVRVPAVEAALEGVSLDASGIAPALAVATDGLTPPDDALASAWYRREVAPVHLRRLLLGETQR